VSGQHLVYFDPHCLHLPRVTSADPGKRVDFTQAALVEQYPDQFLPYCVWGNDMRRRFHGTVFRFPLRTAQQVRGLGLGLRWARVLSCADHVLGPWSAVTATLGENVSAHRSCRRHAP